MIGQMDQEIAFQTYTEVEDGAGGRTRAWKYISHDPYDWAAVKPKMATEKTIEGRVTAVGVYMFTIRQRDDLDERMRIEWDGKFYNIRSLGRRGDRAMYQTIEAEGGV